MPFRAIWRPMLLLYDLKVTRAALHNIGNKTVWKMNNKIIHSDFLSLERDV